jgi:hypothetical protein
MSAPVSPEPQPIVPAARDSAVQPLAQRLADEYVFPDVGAELQSLLLTRLGERACDAIDTAPALAAQLTADLAEVAHDRHLRVNVRLPPGAAPPLPRAPRAGIRRLEILPDNIGYIALDAVPPLELSRAAIGGAFAFLQQTDALIIDNRNNFGGSPATVAHYSSYLSEGPPVLVSTLHERADRRIVEFYTEDLGQRSYGTSRPHAHLRGHLLGRRSAQLRSADSGPRSRHRNAGVLRRLPDHGGRRRLWRAVEDARRRRQLVLTGSRRSSRSGHRG